MKKRIIYGIAFAVAAVTALGTKLQASVPTTDCSVESSKVCVTVENGPYTTVYRGKAKATSIDPVAP